MQTRSLPRLWPTRFPPPMRPQRAILPRPRLPSIFRRPQPLRLLLPLPPPTRSRGATRLLTHRPSLLLPRRRSTILLPPVVRPQLPRPRQLLRPLLPPPPKIPLALVRPPPLPLLLQHPQVATHSTPLPPGRPFPIPLPPTPRLLPGLPLPPQLLQLHP